MNNPFSLRSEMGIRKRVFFLILVVLVPLLLLQCFTFYKWYRGSKKAEMQANLELARTVSKTFDAFIKDILRTQLAIGLAATASPPPSVDSLRRILQAAEETNPMLRSFSWISPAGVNLVTTNTAIENQKIRGQTLFPRILRGEEYGVSDLYYSPYTGEKVFVIGRGIRDPRGDLLGIISCVCVVDKLDSLLAVQRLKDAGISLIDSKGIHVYRYPATSKKYTPEQMNWLKLFPVIRDVLSGKEATAEVSGFRGETRLVAFVPIPFITWVAAASRAEHEVVKGIIQTLLPDALFMLLVTLAAFGVAITLSRPITTSIRRLQDHAAALGQGEVERLEMVLGPREIRSLSEAFNDMAEKIRSREQALQESERNFRALFENSPDAVFLTSPDGSFAAANPAACTMLGYSEEEIYRLGRSGVFDPDDPRLSAVLEERQRTGRILAQELKAIRKSGERFPVEVDSVILPTEPVWSFVIMRDITERKQAEEDVRAARDMQQLIMNNIPQGIFWKDRSSTYLGCNNVFAKSVGMESAWNIVGKTDYDLPWLTEQAESFREYDRRIMENDAPEYHIIEQQREADGKLSWVETNKVPLHDAQGNVIGILGTYEDITERKRVEEALKASEEKYRHLVKYAPTGIYEVDFVNKRFKSVNDVMCQVSRLH